MITETGYNIQIEKLFSALDLGEVIGIPQSLSGGHLHRVFSVQTAQHKYAVKALNPQVMLRSAAMQNIIDSENIANTVIKIIPAVAAISFDGSFIQEFDGQYYLVYNFVDGKSIMPDEISNYHCAKMGEILADIHMADFSSLGFADNYSSKEAIVHWEYYFGKGREADAPWLDIYKANIEHLIGWNMRLVRAAKQLSCGTVISHGDLEPKNVIWQNGCPIIIDWEAAGFVHPAFDLVETAVYWSKEADGSINKEKFYAFVHAYKNKNPLPPQDWNIILDKGFVMLGWLEYSLKRSLLIECTDLAEQKMGTDHVFGTICNLLMYDKMIPMLEEWLKDI